jgi:cytochrome c biogenesis protein CcmG/thiol:disulfide interchange protein DsbE
MPRGVLRLALVPILVVPLAWLIFTGLGNDPRDLPSQLIGKPLPAFAGTTLDGTPFSSDELLGRPAIVNVWASWCIPACVDEHPVLMAAAAAYSEQLAVVGVLYQDTADGARAFLARYGDGGWPNVLDASGRITVDLGVTGPPETFFVDASGIVRARHVGPLTAEAMAEQLTALGLEP